MAPGTRIELFVRSLARTGANRQIEDTIDCLERLVDRNIVEEYTVTVWGRELGPAATRTEAGRHILDSIESFEDWAASEGVTVDRFYETRSVERELTGETYSVTALPAMAMAEYEDDVLRYVTPHEEETTVRSVHDRLAAIAGRDAADRDARPAAPTA